MKNKRLQILVSLSILVILFLGTALYAVLTYRVVRETVARQILEDGQVLAATVRDVVAATHDFDNLTQADLSSLQQLCGSIAVPNSGFVCIVDEGGRVVAGPREAGDGPPSLAGARVRRRFDGQFAPRSTELAELPIESDVLGLLAYPRSPRRELLASVPIGTSGYRLQVHQDYAAVLSRANDAGRGIVPLGIAVSFVVSAIAFFVVDRIVERYETRLRRANDQLREANRRLTAGNNHRKHLIHVLSHDLKNAIGAIVSAQEIVAAYPEERDLYERIISEGARNSLRIVDLVRMTEAIETGKLELSLQPVQLLHSVLKAIEVVQNKIRRKDVTVDVDIDQGLYVLAEETSFVNSVLVNLLSNAIKFSSRGSTIGASAEQKGDTVALSVTDHGIGIPKPLIDKLFEPAEPTTRAGTEGEEGTGFGLPLTGKFVEAYGGSLTVASEEATQSSRGWTRITVRLRSISSLAADRRAV